LLGEQKLMHDIKDIRTNPDKYREGLTKRGQDPGVIDAILELDGLNRARQDVEQTAQSKRNKLTDQYGRLKTLQNKGETTYTEDGETYDIETGLRILTLEQALVDLDESIAKCDIRIEYLTKQQERMVVGFSKTLGFDTVEEFEKALRSEVDTAKTDAP
jgi:seryl-tRNA synthetase